MTPNEYSRSDRVAFVLSGGASLGAVQVGVLRALYERGIVPDLVVGTSVGAINGAFIASRSQTVETADVNVTLLFAIERCEQAIDAFLRGLTARAGEGAPLDGIASVAPFFVSRIDTKVDAQLRERSPLRGRVAIANGRVAYQRYLTKFAGAEWEPLQALGSRTQRALWASTGTKDPSYSDVLYFSELIGPDVVNTMPEQTLRVFADHGEVRRTLDADPQAAERTLTEAHGAGIDLDAATAELEREGVQSFCDSYHQLLDCVEGKIGALTPAGGTRGA